MKCRTLGPVLVTHLRSCFRLPWSQCPQVLVPACQGGLLSALLQIPLSRGHEQGQLLSLGLPFSSAWPEPRAGKAALCHQQLPRAPVARGSYPSVPWPAPAAPPALSPCAAEPVALASSAPIIHGQERWEPGRQLGGCWLCPSLPGSYLTSSRTPSSHLGRVLQLWIPYL